MAKARYRLEKILEKITYIDKIIDEAGSITKALQDSKTTLPAILMHLTSIAEQFNKLAIEGEFELLSHYDKRDLKGYYDLRNYIVHDYEGINLAIIEEVLRSRLPVLQKTTERLLSKF